MAWEQHFDNTKWQNDLSFTWDGDSWTSAAAFSRLQSIGTWYLGYRPSLFRATFDIVDGAGSCRLIIWDRDQTDTYQDILVYKSLEEAMIGGWAGGDGFKIAWDPALKDFFSGSNGDPPNSDIWTVDNPGAVGPEIQGNQCRFGVTNADAFASMLGLFDIPASKAVDPTIYYNMVSSVASNNWYVAMRLTSLSTGYYTEIRYSYQAGNYKFFAAYYDGTFNQYDTDILAGPEDAGRLRLLRSAGGGTTPYYDIGGGWVGMSADGGNGIGTDAGVLQMYLQCTSNQPTTTVDFEDLIVGYPDSTLDVTNMEFQSLHDAEAYSQDGTTPDVFGQLVSNRIKTIDSGRKIIIPPHRDGVKIVGYT